MHLIDHVLIALKGFHYPILEKLQLHAHLKTSAKAALPTLGEPKVMQRTSEVGLCNAAQHAAMVARDPPTQKPVSNMRRGVRPPAHKVTKSPCVRILLGIVERHHMQYKVFALLDAQCMYTNMRTAGADNGNAFWTSK